jgi:acyl-CoA synthetase (AMP-forming)/AMP-acid ligase II
MSGYWNKKGLTAEVIRDGWIHTQDLGFVDGNRLCRRLQEGRDHLGRGEHLLLGSGRGALRAHPDVADVAVIAVPDEACGESAKACVQMRPGRSASEMQLIDYTRTIDFVQSPTPRTDPEPIDARSQQTVIRDGRRSR